MAAPDENIGDTLIGLGDLAGALGSYRAAVSSLETLAARNSAPSHTFLLTGALTTLRQKIGDILAAQGELEAALQSYQSALEMSRADHDLGATLLGHYSVLAIRAQLAAADPSNIQLQRAVAEYAESSGATLSAQGWPRTGALGGALGLYQEALTIHARLSAADPDDSSLKSELAATASKAEAIQRELAQPLRPPGTR